MPEPELETSFWIPEPRSPSLESRLPSERDPVRFCKLLVSLETVSPMDITLSMMPPTLFTKLPTLLIPLPSFVTKSEPIVWPSPLTYPPRELIWEPS